MEITDARHLDLERPAEVLWDLVGRFDAILDWWPAGFVACDVSSEVGIGTTRTLTRQDGSRVVERLIEYRPDERMLQLTIDEGLPPAIRSYTCRYEVRPVGDSRCRLDWYPRALVDASRGRAVRRAGRPGLADGRRRAQLGGALGAEDHHPARRAVDGDEWRRRG